MRVSYDWLKEFVEDLPDPYELAERLTLRGLEVESVEVISPKFRDVIVGRVLEVSEHPVSKGLKVAKVYTGQETLSIVCGAENLSQEMNVALALPGSYLPGGIKIEKKEIGGVVSEGMICSEMELGLSDDHTGIFVLPDELEAGLHVKDLPWLKDFVLDVNCPPNRGDLLSILGIAREVASIVKTKLNLPNFEIEDGEDLIEEYIGLDVLDSEACPRYVLRIVKNVEVKKAPYWMRSRLIKCGMRPINNVVDVTNYVMLELGQPLHAFDYSLLREKKIEVRLSEKEFTFRTLDGQDRLIIPGDLLICDGLGPVAIAGVMGGENSEIRETTRCVALESAYFNPSYIRKTSRRLGIKSEASSRFERGVDIEGVDRASIRAINLMKELSGGKVVKGKLESSVNWQKRFIYVPLAKLKSVLGTEIPKEEVKELLASLEIETKGEDESGIFFEIPYFRHDINEYMDIVEEVARIKGYDAIPETLPVIEMKRITKQRKERLEALTRDYLVAAGLYEIVNFSFFGEKDISLFLIGPWDRRRKALRIVNPLSKDMALMRTFLAPSVLKTLSYNIKRGEKNLRFFELGNVFFDEGDRLPLQKRSLAIALTGKERELFWKERFTEYDFYDIKGIVDGLMNSLRVDLSLTWTSEPHLKENDSADLIVFGKKIGWMGEIKEEVLLAYEIEQRVFMAEIDFDDILEHGKIELKIKPISKYPYAFRDFSFFVDDEIPVSSLIEKIKNVSDYVSSVSVFDVFRKEKRSVTFRVFLQSHEGTLRDEEIDAIQERIIKDLTQIEGVSLRT
ncbi:MAG: phenylalanine--tRNA ligase subunit beta [Desulfobacterota bacterium]|nr:phenylalanine--tRNA ligase subunit beta [Thermodesulfobacteriota bacterium]MDW8002000.1 phenylalanine--tRNA ligase subunit beta [Deltaproteobacteria bacterium]